MTTLITIAASLMAFFIYAAMMRKTICKLEDRIDFLEKYSLKDEYKIEIDHANLQLQTPKDK